MRSSFSDDVRGPLHGRTASAPGPGRPGIHSQPRRRGKGPQPGHRPALRPAELSTAAAALPDEQGSGRQNNRYQESRMPSHHNSGTERGHVHVVAVHLIEDDHFARQARQADDTCEDRIAAVSTWSTVPAPNGASRPRLPATSPPRRAPPAHRHHPVPGLSRPQRSHEAHLAPGSHATAFEKVRGRRGVNQAKPVCLPESSQQLVRHLERLIAARPGGQRRVKAVKLQAAHERFTAA